MKISRSSWHYKMNRYFDKRVELYSNDLCSYLFKTLMIVGFLSLMGIGGTLVTLGALFQLGSEVYSFLWSYELINVGHPYVYYKHLAQLPIEEGFSYLSRHKLDGLLMVTLGLATVAVVSGGVYSLVKSYPLCLKLIDLVFKKTELVWLKLKKKLCPPVEFEK